MMPVTVQDLIKMALRSLTEPRVVIREVLQIELSRNALFQLTLLLVILNMIAGLLFQMLAPTGTATEAGNFFSDGLFVFFFLQFGVIIGGVLLFYYVGRLFGGTGTFDACFQAMVWLNFVFFLVQFVVPVARAVSQALESMVFLATLIIGVVQLTAYVKVVHGFERTVQVVFGIFGVQLVLGIVLKIVLSVFGIDLLVELPADV